MKVTWPVSSTVTVIAAAVDQIKGGCEKMPTKSGGSRNLLPDGIYANLRVIINYTTLYKTIGFHRCFSCTGRRETGVML